MAELKKCPFCGGEAEIEREWVDGFYQKYYSCVHVVCQKCYSTIGRTYDDKDRSKGYAIKVWNNRATESEIRASAIEETVEKIKPILKGLEGSIYWYSKVCEQLEQLKERE